MFGYTMRHRRHRFAVLTVLLTIVSLILTLFIVVPVSAQGGENWCQGHRLRFFAGGAEGDAFASIVLRGAQAAAADLGVDVDYIFSGWDVEVMVQQLREAVAVQPDGIAMMGHPGDAAIQPLAEEAAEAGIVMMYQNVDVPEVRSQFGGGYVGADLRPQGRALGDEAIRQFGLEADDTVLVLGPWDQPGRFIREDSTALAFEDAGINVIRLLAVPEWAADPILAIPSITAAVLDNSEVKLIAYPGGQMLGAVPIYMEALDKAPGDIISIGFDTSPAIIQAFEDGWVHLTSDQQPFLQGYLPILSLCGSLVYGFGPLNQDTGAGFVDTSNFRNVGELAIAGFR